MQPLRVTINDPSPCTRAAGLPLAVCRGVPGLWTLRLLALLLVGFSVTGKTWGQANFPPVTQGEIYHVVSSRNELSLTERFSRVIELEKRITRVDGFDPAILTVSALSPHRIRVQAVSAGVTTLVLVDEFDKPYTIEVFIEGDVRYLQSYINRFFPDSSVNAVKVKDSVVLRGVVADPSHISQITEVAEQFFPKVINHMQFGAANQVRLQVRIMEAQRSRIRQLGFNWSLLNNNGYISSNPGGLAAPTAAGLVPGTLPTLDYGGSALSDSSISFGLVNSNSVFRGFLDALKKEGLLRILVETSVVADSGRPASLLSGGEFPILVPQALGTLSVEWREFGVKLEAVPIVLGQGQVILEIAPEFSERDFANAATLNNTTIPAITTRRANTQVRMKFGQTLMIGGLIATRYTAETNKVPILGELPGIGAAFRRVKYDENETELIILVTPEYVAPLDPHQVPDGGPGRFSDVPTDRELYWQGLIEVPNYGGPMPPGASHGDLLHGQPLGEFDVLPVPPHPPAFNQPPGSLTPPGMPEEGPMPYVPAEPAPLQAPGLRPEIPMQVPLESEPSGKPPEVPGVVPPLDASSLPMLPGPARRIPASSTSTVNEAGHWQRSSGRVELSSGQATAIPSESPAVPAHAAGPGERQIALEDFASEPPALIGPAPRKVEAATTLAAPMP
ncbi:MAG: pilus assembly protein N-terminal domain-containing protein [Planctomycetaceae bacterium]|nr:pilus assembly protein N-terminal domain-containing protein [Planctomycetaceae bacterium]